MTTNKILFFEQNAFTEVFQTWCEKQQAQVELIDSKDNLLDECDGLIIFHENHNFSKEAEQMREYFEKNNKLTHKVDINGTLVATTSNLTLWMERNKIKTAMVCGVPELVQNENLSRFLDKVAEQV